MAKQRHVDTDRRRFRRALAGAGLVAVVVLAGATPASAGPPAPAVPVTPAPAGGAGAAFGANAAGDVFYNSATYLSGSGVVPGQGRVRRADGTVVSLAEPIAPRGAVGPDGRLWTPGPTGVRAIAPDGTVADYVVAGSPSATVQQVEVGPDGRIWFLDRTRNGVGSLATDGTGASFWTVAGAGGLWRLAPGVDGRMWVARTGGLLQAITTTGTVSTYATLGSGVTGLRATSGSLYAMVKGSLVRIAPDGGRTTVWSTADEGFVDVGSADGWAWFVAQDDVIAVSPSGRVAPFGVPQSYAYPSLSPEPSFAPAAAGGFVGSVGNVLVRVPSAAVNETFTASGTVISKGGAFVLRITATGRTPGGSPLSGPVDVDLWGNQLLGDSIGYYQEVRQTGVGRVDLVGGRATLDIPITAALVRKARPGGLLHTFCCSVTVRRPNTATGPGLSSPMGGVTNSLVHSYYGSVVASTTMIWLDAMSSRATGSPMDANGQVYWAGRLAAGSASRLSVTRTVVGSASYRRHRATVAYQRWFGRAPSTSERDYWAKKLETGTTSAMDLALAVKPAARDAGGTSNAARANHLAAALGLSSSYATGFKSKLDAGTSWATVVQAAYNSSGAKEARINAMGPRSSFTPSLGALGSELVRTGDERGPLTSVLATLPITTDGY